MTFMRTKVDFTNQNLAVPSWHQIPRMSSCKLWLILDLRNAHMDKMILCDMIKIEERSKNEIIDVSKAPFRSAFNSIYKSPMSS